MLSNLKIQTAACALAQTGAMLACGQGVPEWTADAVWYQVFVSRFCNGDPTNDPPGTIPWDAEWLALQPGEGPPLERALARRRYGGDLRGVIQKLPYLRDLGINAIYLNPIFQARTEHKYDTSDYRHIDETFGGDQVFRELLRSAHTLGIRVVLDGVFNHVGEGFWAWQDVLKRGRASPYADWFEVTEWGSTEGTSGIRRGGEGTERTGRDEQRPIAWNGWSGPGSSMVRVARVGAGLHPQFEVHIFDITRRWMDPNGDGDPSDGIDGWRLDVADAVPHDFWKRWRAWVKSINPSAVIVGEVWGDASAWLAGDEFDAVMNYSFARPVIAFFRKGASFPATRLVHELEQVLDRHPWPVTLSMQNLLDSHDTDRVLSMLGNAERPYDRDNKPTQGVPAYAAAAPDEDTFRRLRLATLLQFTWPGGPFVYYGTERGMYGADDPYCREPLSTDVGVPAAVRLREYYRGLSELRRTEPALRRGRLRLLLADDTRRVVVFRRQIEDEAVVVALNAGPESVEIELGDSGKARILLRTDDREDPGRTTAGVLRVPAASGQVFKLER